jgi:hypothetical protein
MSESVKEVDHSLTHWNASRVLSTVCSASARCWTGVELKLDLDSAVDETASLK